jgi:hypothetical protein
MTINQKINAKVKFNVNNAYLQIAYHYNNNDNFKAMYVNLDTCIITLLKTNINN